MIPKTIHCCWLGDGEKDSLSLKCRESWARFAPDWQIREWTQADLENRPFPVPPFVREAIVRRKWAFAADWVRFLALYLEGGIYFDYDFELLAPIDDLLAQGEFVAGQWCRDGSTAMEPAIIALEPHSPVAEAMLRRYADLSFDGKTTVGDILSTVAPSLRTLPPEVFSPIDTRGNCRRGKLTRGIHHFAMAWGSPSRRLCKWLCWHGFEPLIRLLLALRGTSHR